MIKTRKRILATFVLTCVINSILCQEMTITERQFDVPVPPKMKSASHQSRMRKSKKTKEKNQGFVKKEKKPKKPAKKTYIEMEYDQLMAAKNVQKENGNSSAVIKYIDRLLKLCTDLTTVSELVLELADTYFADRQFNKSAIIYSQYCALYPGSKQQEYAIYRSIESLFAETLPFDRDQSKTEETLAAIEIFLKNEHFTEYRDKIIHIQKECNEQLAASECNVCAFYLNKGCLRAAEKRLTKLREVWLPKAPTIEPDIIALEAQLTEQKEMVELLIAKNRELTQTKHEVPQQPEHMTELVS